jgi:RNA polymerase sigma-70 factor (ECF subfamily)
VCNGEAEVCELMSVSTSEAELRALMISGLDGDAAAHRTLLENLSSRLRGYFQGQLNRIGRGPIEAEDLVQEALIAIHTRRHTYDTGQLFTPWVYAIARYKFVDYLRREKASMRDQPIEETKELLASSDNSGQVESSLDLERLMAGLAPKVRQAIQAVKLDGLSVGEAAAQCGLSESNVKVTIHRGLKAMARLIRESRS